MVVPIENIGGKFWRDLKGGESDFKALNMNRMRPQGLLFVPDPDNFPLEVEILPVNWINGTSLDAWPGLNPTAVTPSQTTSFWLDGSQPPATQLQSSTTGFPVLSTDNIFLLGQVVANATQITDIIPVGRTYSFDDVGVNTVTANSPLVQSGTPADVVIDLPNATPGSAGAMSAADKTKLDAVPDPATILVDGDYANPGDLLQGADPGPGPSVLSIGGPGAIIKVDEVNPQLEYLPLGTVGQFLRVNGAGDSPEWATVGLGGVQNDLLSLVPIGLAAEGQLGGALAAQFAVADVFGTAIALNGGNNKQVDVTGPGTFFLVWHCFQFVDNSAFAMQIQLDPAGVNRQVSTIIHDQAAAAGGNQRTICANGAFPVGVGTVPLFWQVNVAAGGFPQALVPGNNILTIIKVG